MSWAREKVGDFPLVIKMNCDDFVEGGVTADTFAYMEEIIGQAGIEFLSLCRPPICEPDLPNRWREAQGGANAECLACNLWMLLLNEGPVQCLVKKNKWKRKDIE